MYVAAHTFLVAALSNEQPQYATMIAPAKPITNKSCRQRNHQSYLSLKNDKFENPYAMLPANALSATSSAAQPSFTHNRNLSCAGVKVSGRA